jgi:hypothetical protein
VVHATLTVGDVFSKPLPREPGAIAEATTRAAERLRACVRPRTAAQGGETG